MSLAEKLCTGFKIEKVPPFSAVEFFQLLQLAKAVQRFVAEDWNSEEAREAYEKMVQALNAWIEQYGEGGQ